MPGTRAYVGLGANIGDPARQVAVAAARLAQWPGVTRWRCSRLYRTPPWGMVAQRDFVNAVAEIEYAGSPRSLLDGLLAVEREAGRVRGDDRWGPRKLDLDLLVFGDERIDEPGLSLPHPRIAERAFVLVPLAELAPALHVPGAGRADALLAAVDASAIAALDC